VQPRPAVVSKSRSSGECNQDLCDKAVTGWRWSEQNFSAVSTKLPSDTVRCLVWLWFCSGLELNEILYSWTFKFHKVVQQQNSSAVEDFIVVYSAVYLRIQKRKNYWNRSTFAKVIAKIKVTPPTVYTSLKSTFSAQQFRRWHGSIFMRLAVVAFQICEVAQNSEKIWTYIAVQGHPRSIILVLIECLLSC